jgi:hypothetical protein
MADLRNFSVTRNGTARPTLPNWTISGQVVEVNLPGAATKTDFSGANAISFPGVLTQLTAAQQDELVGMVVMFVLQCRGIL